MPSREIERFIARWSAASPSERANAQLFLVELCDLLSVPQPKTMAERVKAVNGALALVKQPVTAADVAKGFARVKAADVGEILETLCAMSHARHGKTEGTFLP